jgi:hypothetical protein
MYFFHSAGTLSLLGPNTLPGTVFSKAHNLLSSLGVTAQFSVTQKHSTIYNDVHQTLIFLRSSVEKFRTHPGKKVSSPCPQKVMTGFYPESFQSNIQLHTLVIHICFNKRFKNSRMWRCAFGGSVPELSKERTASLFGFKHSKSSWTAWPWILRH